MAPFLIPLITSVAPALVRLASGSDRAEAVARSVGEAVERATGIRPETPEQATDARRLLEQDPALAAGFAEEMRRIEVQEVELLLRDRREARRRDVEVRRLTGGANTRANVMLVSAFAAIVAIAAVLVLLNVYGVDAQGEQLQFTGAIVGFLTGVGGMFARNIGSAFDFEFGSSRGSRTKDGRIEQLNRELNAARSGRANPAQGAAGEAVNAALAAFRRSMAGPG